MVSEESSASAARSEASLSSFEGMIVLALFLDSSLGGNCLCRPEMLTPGMTFEVDASRAEPTVNLLSELRSDRLP